MAEDTATQEAPPAESEDARPPDLGEAGQRAIDAMKAERASAQRTAREAAKERDALAARLKDIEDRDKSEVDKLNERASTAEQRVAQAEARALRLEVAFDKGLTPQQAKRLVGESREDLEADAEEILRDFPARTAQQARGSFDLGVRQDAGAPLDPIAQDRAQIEADIRASRARRR